MKALVKTAPRPGCLECREVAEPELEKNEMLIQVHAAGICGTDLSLFQWYDEIAAIYNPPMPLILGHEFSGVVVAAAPDAGQDWIGRRVCVNPVHYCGTCRYCLQGRQSLCVNRPCLGMELNGGFAEYVKVRQENVFVIPDSVSFRVAALSEPFCVALHALEQAGSRRSDCAVVVGTGAIGLLQVVALRTAGVERCIVTGLPEDAERLALARRLGAETVIAGRQDFDQCILDRTDGYGADVVFETSGHPDGVSQAIQVAGKGGKIALIGFPHEPIDFYASHIAVMEKEIIGVRAHNHSTWERCIELLPKVTHFLDQIVTHEFSLEDGVNAFELGEKRIGGKVMIMM